MIRQSKLSDHMRNRIVVSPSPNHRNLVRSRQRQQDRAQKDQFDMGNDISYTRNALSPFDSNADRNRN